MDLTQLANLGEFIGGVAVLVTLIYLAVQVRSGNQAARGETGRATLADFNGYLDQLVRDPALLLALRRGFVDFQGLSHQDQSRVHLHWTAVLMSGQQLFYQEKRGIADARWRENIERFNAGLLCTPGAEHWWNHAQAVFSPDFVAYMEDARDRLRSTGALGTHELLPWYALEEGEAGEAGQTS